MERAMQSCSIKENKTRSFVINPANGGIPAVANKTVAKVSPKKPFVSVNDDQLIKYFACPIFTSNNVKNVAKDMKT